MPGVHAGKLKYLSSEMRIIAVEQQLEKLQRKLKKLQASVNGACECAALAMSTEIKKPTERWSFVSSNYISNETSE